MNGYRRYRLETELDRVQTRFALRRPQALALGAFHEMVLRFGDDIPVRSRDELLDRVREWYPGWSFGADYPEVTFDLATGVGKTRLMGAIATYLFRTGQASSFVFFAPRRAILRKLLHDLKPTARWYLFGDPALVPEPQVWHAGNLDSFNPEAMLPGLSPGPEVFVLSPQAITGGERRATRPSEFTGMSVVDYLADRPDLIVFFDEAHHLGKPGDAETKVWTEAVRELRPRLYCGMTATPLRQQGVNTIYRYGLSECLRDGKYTKAVRLIVRQRPTGLSDEDWDRVTLEFALDRRDRKEAELNALREHSDFPSFRPVLLVAAADTAHADEVGRWLVSVKGLDDEEVLVTHTRRSKSEEELERLLRLEEPTSAVKVIVNVYELTEGWDVTNVYVIAPLRKLESYTGALQTMGRGLRLPAGKRVENLEADTLDVLCFGKESLDEILSAAMLDFGDPEDQTSVVGIVGPDDDDLNNEPPTKSITIDVSRGISLQLPLVRPLREEPELDFDIKRAASITPQRASEFILTQDTVHRSVEQLTYEEPTFVRLASSKVLSSLRFLTDPAHRPAVDRLVRSALDGLGVVDRASIQLDWVQVALLVGEAIERQYRRRPARYRALTGQDLVRVREFSWRVPESVEGFRDTKLDPWGPEARRVPYAGWSRTIFEAAPFDTEGEFQVASTLDRAAEVSWWMRNDPALVRIPTPIGGYHPDFIVLLNADGADQVLILEVKGEDFWRPSDSDARVKSRSADLWCQAVNDAGAEPTWRQLVVLDADAKLARSLAELEEARVN